MSPDSKKTINIFMSVKPAKTRFETFTEEVENASKAFGLAHVFKTITNEIPADFPKRHHEEGLSGGLLYRRDQNCCEVFLNPESDDDPAGVAWHEMAELSLFDLEEFCRKCARTGKFDHKEWEHLAHCMVNRMVAAARPAFTHIVKKHDQEDPKQPGKRARRQ